MKDNTDDGFEMFWKIYPRKIGKAAARKAWRARRRERPSTEALVRHVKLYAKTEWADREKRMIPHPATYLNGERWEDELDDPCANLSEAAKRRIEELKGGKDE